MVPVNIFQLNFSNSEADRMVKTESSSSQYARQFNFSHDHQELGYSEVESMKAKIVAHPQYPKLLDAYIDYQNVGAPPEVVAKLLAGRQESEARQRFPGFHRDSAQDPELDQFMENYCGMLVKCREELKRTLQEAMNFMQNMEARLNMLSDAPVCICNSEENYEDFGTSEEDQENNNEESELPDTDPRADDRDLKNHLLRKYGTYLSGLKQELSKKRKKGKLPKDARQKLLNWWQQNYKWPYPSEAEKKALAESTCLDHKQINNWFINQRKRHWKPSEDMHFTMMDGHPSQSATLCMEGHYMGSNPSYRLGP